MSILTIENLSYHYENSLKTVLKDISLTFEPGKLYCIIGKSGAGKSTFLSLISGLDVCSSGTIYYENEDLKSLNRDEYRAKHIGIIFQGYNLLKNRSAIENIVLSMNISKNPSKTKKSDAYQLLSKLGIDKETANRKVYHISGGEQQRISIARALSHNPNIVIADEPTGNLDADTAKSIMNIFINLAHKENKCVIIVTHSKEMTSCADEILQIENGKIK